MRTYEEDRSTKLVIEEAMSCKILGRQKETKLFMEYAATRDYRRRQEIKTAIIQSNLKFCLKMARDYKKSTGLPLNDFYSEGKLGMLEAFSKFDYREGVKFVSFAVFEMRRHMDMIVHNNDQAHIPVRLRKKVLKARKKGEDVSKIKYGTLAENAMGDGMSLATPVSCSDDGGITIGDILPSEDLADTECAGSNVADRLTDLMEDNLSAEENSLLRRIYGLDGWEESVGDLASDMRVSKESLRRLKSRALAKLRKLPDTEELKASYGS